MRITILAVGARGDVQPYVALGTGLKAAGYEVRLATHAVYENLARPHGIDDFFRLEGNPREVLENTEEGRAFLQSGSNPLLIGRRFVGAVGAQMKTLLVDSWQACQSADAIVFSPLAFFGHDIAEKLQVPPFGAFVAPMTRTRQFPSILSPANFSLGGAYNWLRTYP